MYLLFNFILYHIFIYIYSLEKHHYIDVVRYLLTTQLPHIKMNAQDRNEDTCLHIACKDSNMELATLLIDYGADIDVENEVGRRCYIIQPYSIYILYTI